MSLSGPQRRGGQTFRVVRCFSCDTFQIDQCKKVSKFVCKICNAKQSVRKIYFEGTGRECRQMRQTLSEAQAATDQWTQYPTPRTRDARSPANTESYRDEYYHDPEDLEQEGGGTAPWTDEPYDDDEYNGDAYDEVDGGYSDRYPTTDTYGPTYTRGWGDTWADDADPEDQFDPLYTHHNEYAEGNGCGYTAAHEFASSPSLHVKSYDGRDAPTQHIDSGAGLSKWSLFEDEGDTLHGKGVQGAKLPTPDNGTATVSGTTNDPFYTDRLVFVTDPDAVKSTARTSHTTSHSSRRGTKTISGPVTAGKRATTTQRPHLAVTTQLRRRAGPQGREDTHHTTHHERSAHTTPLELQPEASQPLRVLSSNINRSSAQKHTANVYSLEPSQQCQPGEATEASMTPPSHTAPVTDTDGTGASTKWDLFM
eukprot:m.202167 g.202167  ORF g.202167 m.202167 type:complete len:423 (+) comp21692_c0_seq1:175-1443(+)